jgi:hypothetical protein
VGFAKKIALMYKVQFVVGGALEVSIICHNQECYNGKNRIIERQNYPSSSSEPQTFKDK